MPRYIDADALLKKQTTIRVTYHCQGADEWDDYEVVLVKDINNAPTISPDEVRGVGKWVDKGVRAWSCSCCGTPLNHIRQFASFEKNELPNYCPNCGAKMKGVSEDA